MLRVQRRMRLFTLIGLTLAVGGICAPLPADTTTSEEVKTAGRIDAVTVYRGQALVTREVELPGKAGLHEIVVTDLPDRILPTSLYAESGGGSVEVRSVRYRVMPVKEDVREEVRVLDDQIHAINDQLEAIRREMELRSKNELYLDRLEMFTATTATNELAHGVLNAETLTTLSEFLFDSRESLSERGLHLSRDKSQLSDQLSLLTRQRSQLTGSSARQVREAVLLVSVPKSAVRQATLRLRYLVDGATWSPSYSVRASEKVQDEITLEYYASIEQVTGENWDEVAMTLSTASPSLIASPPTLNPLNVSLTMPQQTAQFGEGKEYYSARQELAIQQRGVDSMRNSADRLRAGKKGVGADDEALNSLAEQIQVLDLSMRGSISDKSRDQQQDEIEMAQGPSVTYLLKGRASLPSRSDRQLVQIARITAPGSFSKQATPVLTPHVYDQAEVVNKSDLVLLSGPVSTYVDGQFVGGDQLPLVAVGEQFSAGLGIDSSLRSKRELVRKKERIEGGNRVAEFTYRLTVENFNDDDVNVRLLDRLPYPGKAQIEVTFISSGDHDLSDDPSYQNGDRKKGLLRWDVVVPAHSVDADVFVVEYKFSLEYDKQLTISGASGGR